jgi:hypothetical protein
MSFPSLADKYFHLLYKQVEICLDAREHMSGSSVGIVNKLVGNLAPDL